MGAEANQPKILFWSAKLLSLAVAGFLALSLAGGGMPLVLREWLYLAFFPVGFVIALIAAWRWPLQGGAANLLCMLASQLVMARFWPLRMYAIWGLLCIPGIIFVLVGILKRKHSRAGQYKPNAP